MKLKITCVLLLVSGVHYAQIKEQDHYSINDTTISEWYAQHDVLTFRTVNDQPLNSNVVIDDAVDRIEVRNVNQRPAYILMLKAGLSEIQKDVIRQLVAIDNPIEYELTSYSENANDDYKSCKWYPCSELLLITFDDIHISDSTVNEFMTRNKLNLLSRPSDSLPPARWTWIFNIQKEALELQNTFAVARTIYDTEKPIVYSVQPSFLTPDLPWDVYTPTEQTTSYKLAGISSTQFELLHPNEQDVNHQAILINMLGQEVEQWPLEIGNVKTNIDLNKVAKGVYQLQIKAAGKEQSIQAFRLNRY